MLDQPHVMADEEYPSVVTIQCIGERVNCLDVKMIGGFVEHEHVGFGHRKVREHCSALLPVGQVLYLGGLGLACNTLVA